ncbi:MAG: glycosyltransferase family 39 protein [Atopobium sp.]|nr:glycosyltransferase family 39 protein [Atopobium sp.]
MTLSTEEQAHGHRSYKPLHMASCTDVSVLSNARHVPSAKLCLAALLLVQLAVMTYYALAKQGFFVDELWSYGLANSLYFPHLFGNGAMEGKWLTPQVFHSYLEVDPGEQFRFDSVVYNLSQDAHPPLFFMVLHAVSSFFPGTFSKWYGIVPNMVYYVISALALYRLSRKMLKSDYKALVPVLWWGFCAGTISLVIFIRMYMMASMFVMMLLNVHYDLIVEHDERYIKFVQLLALSFLSFMCHYFMFILAFFLAAFTCICLLFQKRWRTFAIYAGCMVGAVLIAFAMFPSAVSNIFGNGYAQEGTSRKSLNEVLNKIILFYSLTDGDLFGGINALQTLALLFTAIVAITNLIRPRRDCEQGGRPAFVLTMTAAAAFFFIVVAISAPWPSSRYECFVYPIAVVASSWAIISAIDLLAKARKRHATAAYMILSAGMVIVSMLSYGTYVSYIYPQEDENLQAMTNYGDSSVLLVTSDYYKVVQKSLEIEKTQGVLATVSDPASLEAAARQVDQNAKSFLVYIDTNPHELYGRLPEEVMEDIVEDAGYEGFRSISGYTDTPGDGVDLRLYEVYADAA